MHEIRFDKGIFQFLQLNDKTLLFRESRRIWLWNIRTRQFVCRWSRFPGAGQTSTTQIAVPSDNNNNGGDRFFLAHAGKFHVVQIVKTRNNRLHVKLARTQCIPGWDDITDKNVLQITVQKNRIAVETNARIVVFAVSDGKMLFQFPFRRAPWFDVADNFVLTDRFLVYYDNKAGQILVRDLDSSKLFARSPLMTDLRFRPEQDPTLFKFRSARFSATQTTLVCRLTFLKANDYWHVIVVSSLLTGKVSFTHLSRGNVIWFTPHLHPGHGVIIADAYKTILVPLHEHHHTQTLLDDSHVDVKSGLEWKGFDLTSYAVDQLVDFHITRDNVEKLKMKSAAALLAAFVCRFDPERRERFETLTRVLEDCFREHDIDGLVVSDREVVPAEDLADMIVKYVREHHEEVSGDMLLKGKIKAFLNKFEKTSTGSAD